MPEGSCEDNEGPVILISCSTRCFPQETAERALVRIAWAGFRAAEVAYAAGDTLSADGLGQRLEADTLELVAIDAGVVASPSVEGALEAMAHVGRAAVLAQELGAPRVVLSAPGQDAGSLDYLAYGLAKLLEALADVPVDLALRHASGSLVETPAAFRELYERVGSPRLAFALDPAEAVLTGWRPEEALDELAGDSAPRVAHVYLTDLLDGRRVVPGAGVIDWDSQAARLAAYDYNGAVSLLFDGEDSLHAETDAKEACAYAEEVFAGVV
jgi:sugar phosphate isomerase/epimerase